jgi:hypothetical protein
MAITKTKFINYVRCPRYVALEEVKKENLEALVSLKDYKEEEREQVISEVLSSMTDDEGNDLIDVVNEQLEIMMPYYNEIELIAGRLVEEKFSGKAVYSKDTLNQESFDAKFNGIRYICYVDIYNEKEDSFDIIEVKATTTNKFLDLGKKTKGVLNSIFIRDIDNIYRLREEINGNVFDDDLPEKDYQKHKAKLYNKYNGAGHYVYDLAVQRYIIENDLKQNNQTDKINKIRYYLAVLNKDYVFDGKYEDGKPVYGKDSEGNNIVDFIDLTSVTKDYMDIIDIDRKKIEAYISELKLDDYKIGEFCEKKKTTKCKYCPVCWSILPEKNSIMNYIDNHHGFKDDTGYKYERYDLINDGKVHMLDIPDTLLNRRTNQIQRDVVKNNKIFINKSKIKEGIKEISYPIYHLDFETFPCPLPRYKDEKCYMQSVFQFSLHIEKEPGVCDKNNDHYEFLAYNHDDLREELVKKMCEYIDVDSGGTILVYNESFEKTRLKELGEIYPFYKSKLNKMITMIFDLMYLVKTNTELYKNLGFEEEEAKLFNYYHTDLNGSFSIKKVLPLFSELTYKGMEVGNGMEALTTYASFPNLSKKEFDNKYKALTEYCKQDTWAMVEILKGLRELVK